MTQLEVQNNPLLQGINWEKAAEVFAMIDAAATNESGISDPATMPGDQWSSSVHGHGSPVIEASSGLSAIYGWNEV